MTKAPAQRSNWLIAAVSFAPLVVGIFGALVSRGIEVGRWYCEDASLTFWLPHDPPEVSYQAAPLSVSMGKLPIFITFFAIGITVGAGVIKAVADARIKRSSSGTGESQQERGEGASS